MLLEHLTIIAKNGSQLPISFCKEFFREEAALLSPQLEAMLETLPENTKTKKVIKTLKDILINESPDEILFAESLVNITEIFVNNTPEDKQEAVANFKKYSKMFLARLKRETLYRKVAIQKREKMDDKQQFTHDKDLFQNVGMPYIIEYYLSIYKALIDANTPEEQKQILDSPVIDIGWGEIPGLKIDTLTDETLKKFYLHILHEKIKTDLIKSFYLLKKLFLENAEPKQIVDQLKIILPELFQAYEKFGITQIKTLFMTPYGDSPKFSDINL